MVSGEKSQVDHKHSRLQVELLLWHFHLQVNSVILPRAKQLHNMQSYHHLTEKQQLKHTLSVHHSVETRPQGMGMLQYRVFGSGTSNCIEFQF